MCLCKSFGFLEVGLFVLMQKISFLVLVLFFTLCVNKSGLTSEFSGPNDSGVAILVMCEVIIKRYSRCPDCQKGAVK